MQYVPIFRTDSIWISLRIKCTDDECKSFIPKIESPWTALFTGMENAPRRSSWRPLEPGILLETPLMNLYHVQAFYSTLWEKGINNPIPI